MFIICVVLAVGSVTCVVYQLLGISDVWFFSYVVKKLWGSSTFSMSAVRSVICVVCQLCGLSPVWYDSFVV